MSETAIVWFRNDLRIHDNEALVQACKNADNIIPVYIFDTRVFKGNTSFGFAKTGHHRAKFILESIIELKQNLQNIGSNLYVGIGKPEEIIADIAITQNAAWVYCNRERTQEEVLVQDRLEKKIWEKGIEIVYTRGKMMYYTSDLPFPIRHTPDTFTNFRKEVEKSIPIRKPLPPLDHIATKLDEMEWGDLPAYTSFGIPDKKTNHSKFVGGEMQGLKQLKYYLWDTDLLKTYKDSRNELLGWNFSSKFSPWLSTGCLSPKQIYHEIRLYEKERGSNDSTYWLFFELLWRDYFRLIGKKHGNQIFKKEGIRSKETDLSEDKNLIEKWINGCTGYPFIDANMRELKETGFMSNRGRQVVASFLVNDLKVNWVVGAEYFESMLLDYDPCSNYGNWNYIAGVGNDPREDRYFNIHSQVKKYDEKGAFTKHWVPEIASLPQEYFYRPYDLDEKMQTEYNFIPGSDYPLPITTLQAS